jgi:hypothetical protein
MREDHGPHREAARLQAFPDSFYFVGSKIEIAKQIGNAVPPLLAYAIAKEVQASLQRRTTREDMLPILQATGLICGEGHALARLTGGRDPAPGGEHGTCKSGDGDDDHKSSHSDPPSSMVNSSSV